MNSKKILRAYELGVLTMACVHGLVQDIEGKETVLRHVRDYWITSRISGPIESLGLCVCLVALWHMLAAAHKSGGAS